MENRPLKWLALGLFLSLSAGLGAVAVGRMDQMALASNDLRDQPFALADALLRANLHIHELHTRLHDVIYSVDHGAVLPMQLRSTDDDRELAAALDQVVARHSGDDRTLAELVRALSAWREARERVAELLLDGRWQDAGFLQGGVGERSYYQLRLALDAALRTERLHAEQLRDEAEKARRSASHVILALAVLAAGALAATGVGLATMLGTYRPLRRVRARLLALADGDLDSAIPHVNSGSAVGALARAVATFRQGLVERDEAHRALRLSQRRLQTAMEDACHANAAKSRFLAAASHDLRQPMQALRLYLDTLDRRIEDDLDRRILGGALQALAAGEELLRNFLDVSVLESGILQPELSDVPVAGLMADLAAESGVVARDKGLALHMVDCGLAVRSDAALLKRLLRNLLTNAIRYTSAGRVVMGCRRRGRFLRIEVWDTGIGIPADQLQAVFEDFYQIGNSERDRTKGLGLGLSVVERAARLLGHQITVSSRPGRGSMFAVTVPLAAAPAAAETTQVAA